MKLYADTPARRTRQVLGDLLLLGWLLVWVWAGRAVHDVISGLARPGEQVAAAGGGLARQLYDAAHALGGLPFVGSQVRVPFRGAGEAAGRIAQAGSDEALAVQHLAIWLGAAVAAVPVAVALVVYLPLRWRFVREATAAARLLEADQDQDLLALRALAHQPLHRLSRVSGDPARAWRAGDRQVIARLAELELESSGVSPSRLSRSRLST